MKCGIINAPNKWFIFMTNLKLTQKQENFCLSYVETGNATEAYRRAYNASNMKEETINKRAVEMLDKGVIRGRLDQLRETIMERHCITVDTLIEELEEARQVALAKEAAAPAVSATMGKAKLLGLDKQVVDHISSDGSMTAKPSRIELVAPDMDKYSGK